MSEPIYKICDEVALQEAKRKGRFEDSPDDLRDGFIHLSAGAQLAGTLATHFAGRDGLFLLAVDAERLGDHLKWEPSRGGDLFPHLYGPLDLAYVLFIEALPLGDDGRHRLPAVISPLPKGKRTTTIANKKIAFIRCTKLG
jgi:uncharacterized protein (DUF952 family)